MAAARRPGVGRNTTPMAGCPIEWTGAGDAKPERPTDPDDR